jgi:hypothetical protein
LTDRPVYAIEGSINAERLGPLAQSVEHLTLNQQVPGSIPGRPTSKFKHLSRDEISAFLFGATSVLPLKKNPHSKKPVRDKTVSIIEDKKEESLASRVGICFIPK